jgi:hypothetical protein
VTEQDIEATQERLLEILGQRAHATTAARRAALEEEIALVAAELGLEPEEVESLSPNVVKTARRPPDLVGRFRIYRRGRDIMPFVIGVILMPILAGLGAREMAAAGLVLLVAVWVFRAWIRVAVFDIDEQGRLDLQRHGTVNWHEVEEVTFRYRHPWATVRRSIEREAGETAAVRIRVRDGRSLRLAQGQLFRVKPSREPIGLYRLSRFLKKQAGAAGLKVKNLPGGEGRWRAARV